MFTYVTAMASLRGANQRLTTTNVGNTKVRELMTTYSQCILILSNPALQSNVSLDVSKVVSLFLQYDPDLTVKTWLTAHGNKDLPFDTKIPVVKKSNAKASEAFKAGFDIQRVHPTSGDGNQYPDSELTHLRLTRPDTDYTQLFNYSLASVNGLLHLTDAGADGYRIIDGGKSVWQSNLNDVGLISFASVGKVACFPIKATAITGRGLPLAKGCVLKAAGADFSNKFVMISVGGILHVANQQYKVMGKDTLLLEWWKLPIHRIYHQTRHLVDWTPVTKLMNQNPNHPGGFDIKLMQTDACIKAFLTMPQTFIITVDVPNLFFDYTPVERTGLHGRYYSYVPPVMPLVLDNGFLPPYTIHGNNGVYCLAIDATNRAKYLHDTRNVYEDEQYVTDAMAMAPNKEYQDAYFLDMFTEALVYPA